MLITNFILAEAHGLILSRLNPTVGRRWLLEHTFPIVRVTQDDETRAAEIIRTYDDHAFSYVDATSFAVMERLGIERAFTYDRDFGTFGFSTS